MLALAGMLLVFAAVFGGYLMERGNPWVLLQPAELLIIGGSAVGIILVSNRPAVIRKMLSGVWATIHSQGPDRETFLRHLRMLFELFTYSVRARGMMALERDVEDPSTSPIFSHYPQFLADTLVRDFVCDTLRMLVIGATAPHELDLLMDLDIDVQRRGCHEPVRALSSVADSLPGLGIVAAVLGVVITMEAIGGAPETIGQKVAAALVGTFLGILLCYGVAANWLWCIPIRRTPRRFGRCRRISRWTSCSRTSRRSSRRSRSSSSAPAPRRPNWSRSTPP